MRNMSRALHCMLLIINRGGLAVTYNHPQTLLTFLLERRPPLMFYCGIDLSARHSHICVLDENLSVLLQQKAANELPRIAHLLDPFKPLLQVVIESTFNWYWLVDGLQALGFHVCLAHTLGLAMI